MNIPFTINGFCIGNATVSMNDTGMGFNINSIDFNIDTMVDTSGTNQFEQLLDALPSKHRKLEHLSVEEIDAIMERLRELKLTKA